MPNWNDSGRSASRYAPRTQAKATALSGDVVNRRASGTEATAIAARMPTMKMPTVRVREDRSAVTASVRPSATCSLSFV